jgi:hypothetical protein
MELIQVTLFNKDNEIVDVFLDENIMSAKYSLAAALDGWDEGVEYGTMELVVNLNLA